MSSLFGTRTVLELHVGTTHTVELLVHLRRDDVDWFNSCLKQHQAELFQLVGKKILPKEFGDEVDRYHEDKISFKKKKKEVVVGEKNKKEAAKKETAGNKRKRSKKKEETATKESQQEKRKHDKQVFGKNLQAIYRLETIRPSESALLLYNTESNSTIPSFHQPPKLSKRLALWCFPFDPKNPFEPNPQGGEFPRPEMIPISALFRQAAKSTTSTSLSDNMQSTEKGQV